MTTFTERLKHAISAADSCLCVGLDPDPELFPEIVQQGQTEEPALTLDFLKQVIDATQKHCCAYKPNLAFFERLGAAGLEVFKGVLDYIPEDKIVIADAKRGDIGSTARQYSEAYFKTFGVDAITLNPLMGFETLHTFLENPTRAVFVLTLTTNPGASDFLMQPFQGHGMMAEYIASELAKLDKQYPAHAGMVVGATKTDYLNRVIGRHPASALLIPGLGAQGGSVDDLTESLQDHLGAPVVSSSRSILYAGRTETHWQEHVEQAAQNYKSELSKLTDDYLRKS